jgi:hypothetical protein
MCVRTVRLLQPGSPRRTSTAHGSAGCRTVLVLEGGKAHLSCRHLHGRGTG